ncbi:DNA polymerase III subunit gamma/tau [Chloracidobacterium sp. MS 40/45]|uniref:DNA polymerase III subunit gamma/tau n=1 Tax=Chloracidobacterium aggregatum TaxID=2851959 RepID=UPI001B8B954C|nr:DNA polymerase III subunit gamma/tau [Chloracidobacterium aggregatum]QUW00525.1 DNA polymerase III subunit gamma/tau [Chloracidobacterium sp. MS 40/45]
MAYQVIARKWRPQQFEDVVGQAAITRALSNALRTGRLHHAYLFAGPRGVGKTTCARLFARALNCAEGPTPTPCGVCPSCQETLAGNSLDVLEIDAASHTGVDNIREVIIATVGNRPARDRYKVFIIDEVHMLSTSSFNALLKTLEEPPPHVVFIMATTELHKLPETILSRCQVYEFRTVGVEVIADRLRQIAEAEQVPISRAALVQIAQAGRGSLRDAQSALEQVLAFAGTAAGIDEAAVRDALGLIGIGWLSEVVEALHRSDAAAVLLDVERLVRSGHDLRQFLRELMTYLRHLLVAQLAGADRELLPVADGEVAVIKKQSQYFTVAELIRLFSLVADLEMQVRAAEDPRPLVEVGLVKLTQLGHLKPLEDILARLDTLLAEGARPLSVSSPAAAPTGKRPSTTARPTPPPPSSSRPERPTRAESGPPDRPPLRLAPPPEAAPPEPPPEPPLDVALLEAALPTDDTFDPTNAPEVLARIRQRAEQEKRFLLATQLDSAQSARWDGDRFELTFGPEAKSQEASVREARAFLQEVLHALTGRKVSVVTRLEGGHPPAASEPEADRREKPLRAEAERHPAVKNLQRLFGAELFDVNLPE